MTKKKADGGAVHPQFPNFTKIHKGENIAPLTGSNAPLSVEILRAAVQKAELDATRPLTEEEEEARDYWTEMMLKRAQYFNHSTDPETSDDFPSGE